MRNWIPKILLLLISVLMGLVLAEVVVRIFAPQHLVGRHQNIWRSDSTIGHRHRENIDVYTNLGEGQHRFTTDRYGYRVDSPSADSLDDITSNISLLVLGDSYLEALSVNNNETIPERLASTLFVKYGITVRVSNAGTASWDVNHYLIETRRSLARRPYDLGIIFICLPNDIVMDLDTTFHDEVSGHRGSSLGRQEGLYVVKRANYLLKKLLISHSQLYMFIMKQMQVWTLQLGVSGARPREVFLTECSSARWETTADICALIRDEFSARGIQLLFVLLPAVYQVEEEYFYKFVDSHGIPRDSVDLEQPNTLLATAFYRRSLPLLDPLSYMRVKADQGLHMYGGVDPHFNPEGHRIVAEYILPYMEECLAPKLGNALNAKPIPH